MRNFISVAAISLMGVPLLSGCGGRDGSGAPGAPTSGTDFDYGSLSARVAGASQPPVTASASRGCNVTGIAGTTLTQLILNLTGGGTLLDTRIAFTSDRNGHQDIYSVLPDGSSLFRITTETSADRSPSWNSNGTKLAFATNRDGNFEIYSVNSNGSSPTRLTNNSAEDESPAWSPDGSKIAFMSRRDGNAEIYTMSSTGASPTRLTSNSVDEGNPVWSPDGSKIAFQSHRDGNYEVYSMNADGSNQTRLTDDPSNDGYPAWSPDGSKILFYSSRTGAGDIYVMNSDGSNPTLVIGNSTEEYLPRWSPDGNSLTYNASRDGNREIYTSTFAGTQTNILPSPGSDDTMPNWSGYQPRGARTLVGTGGSLASAASGFLFSQSGLVIHAVMTFDTATPATRVDSRVSSQSAASNDEGTNLIFSITTTEGLASLRYVELSVNGLPGAPRVVTIPAGTTGALVSFASTSGLVASVIPYTANRAMSKRVEGETMVFGGDFSGVWTGGVNRAPAGASEVTINIKTGELVSFRQ